MHFLKKVSLRGWANLAPFIFVGVITFIYYNLLAQPCSSAGPGIDCLYDLKYAIYQPIYFGGRILVVILGLLFFVPTHIFRKWLFYIAPVIILITFYFVHGISVYSSGIMYISRAQMAENGMYFLALVTTVFVLGHLAYDYRKKKQLQK